MLLTAIADLGRRVSDLAFLLELGSASLLRLLLRLRFLQLRLRDEDVIMRRDSAKQIVIRS